MQRPGRQISPANEGFDCALLVLRDWRPGHYNQAEGLAGIIGELCPADVDRIDVRQRRLATNHLRRLALTSPWPSAGRMLALLYDIRVDRLVRPDLVIGAGRPTAAAGILLRRWCGARFVYSGYLRDYDPAEIDLMLVRSPTPCRSAGPGRHACSKRHQSRYMATGTSGCRAFRSAGNAGEPPSRRQRTGVPL